LEARIQIDEKNPVRSVVERDFQPRSNLVWSSIPATSYHFDTKGPPGCFTDAHFQYGKETDDEKHFFACVVTIRSIAAFRSIVVASVDIIIVAGESFRPQPQLSFDAAYSHMYAAFCISGQIFSPVTMRRIQGRNGCDTSSRLSKRIVKQFLVVA
jgi:hypothetical protein